MIEPGFDFPAAPELLSAVDRLRIMRPVRRLVPLSRIKAVVDLHRAGLEPRPGLNLDAAQFNQPDSNDWIPDR